MAKIQLTSSQGKYLEWIYRLSGDGPVQNSAIAQKLGVKLPSVSRAIKSLRSFGLVEHKSYGNIKITSLGKLAAEELVRKDKCLTKLLVDVLGLSKEMAASEVNKLKHTISFEVLIRLEKLVEFGNSSEAWKKRLRLRMKDVTDNYYNKFAE